MAAAKEKNYINGVTKFGKILPVWKSLSQLFEGNLVFGKTFEPTVGNILPMPLANFDRCKWLNTK